MSKSGEPLPAKRPRGRVGPARETQLTPDEIARAALAIIDDRGLAQLSIRALATELKVSPRALYFHHANKAAVLSDVLDLIWDEAGSHVVRIEADGIEWIVQSGVIIRETFLQHPDLAFLIGTIPRPGARLERSIEGIVALFTAAGFTDVGRVGHAYQRYVLGHIAMDGARHKASEVLERDESRLVEWMRDTYGDATAADDPRVAIVESYLADETADYFESGLRDLLSSMLSAPARRRS